MSSIEKIKYLEQQISFLEDGNLVSGNDGTKLDNLRKELAEYNKTHGNYKISDTSTSKPKPKHNTSFSLFSSKRSSSRVVPGRGGRKRKHTKKQRKQRKSKKNNNVQT